jgi:hypothetical protein
MQPDADVQAALTVLRSPHRCCRRGTNQPINLPGAHSTDARLTGANLT